MKAIKISKQNFIKDETLSKEGAQTGYWGHLLLQGQKIYGMTKFDEGDMHFFIECLLSEIAKFMQIPCATYYPIVQKDEGKILTGNFSVNFLKENEKLVYVRDLFDAQKQKLAGQFLKSRQDSDLQKLLDLLHLPLSDKTYSYTDLILKVNRYNWPHTMHSIDNLFKTYEDYEELIFRFVINALFSMTFMNADFNQHTNMQLIQNVTNGKVAVAPIYDLSANTIFRMIDKDWQEAKLVKAIIRRKNCKNFDAFPMLDDTKDCSFNETITELTKKYGDITRIFCDKLQSLLKSDMIHTIITQMQTDELLSPNNAQIARIYCTICVKDTIKLINDLQN